MFWSKRTYLDYAAGAAGNPSSPHEEGRQAKKVLEDARRSIARILEVQADDIVCTSGATESNALAILGWTKKDDHVLYLPSAHASIVENMKGIAERGTLVEPLVIANGKVDIDALKRQIRPNTRLISMEAVCGETGVIWNTREVAQVLQHTGRFFGSLGLCADATQSLQKSPRVLLHVDASQAPWTEKVSRAHFGADVLTLDGAKMGVRGIGVLVAHRTLSAGRPLAPLYRGGGQERGLRPGSEAPELVAAFAAALSVVTKERETFRARAEQARAELVKVIAKSIPNVQINEGGHQAPNILNISLLGRDTDYLVMLLDEAGFAVSTKSACETDSEEGSRAVFALTGDPGRARATLRISWGPDVRPSDLRRFTKACREAVAFIDSNRLG